MAAKVWSRVGVDANWSTGANWNGGTVPVTTDTVTFDGTSVLECTVNNVGTFTGTITITAAYTGATAIITQNVAIVGASAFSIDGGTWTQAAAFTRSTMAVTGGTWTGGSQTMTLSGTLTFSGGSLTMTSGTCTISAGSFTQTNTPTFNANGGTIAFTGGTAAVLTAPTLTFNRITFTKTNVAFTVAAGTTCPLGTGPTNSCGTGTFTINGTVTWTNTLTLTGSLTTASTTTITVSGTIALTINQSLTFDPAATITTALPVAFNGSAVGTVTATAYTFGTCTITKTNDLTIAANTTITLAASPTTTTSAVNATSPLIVNGTLLLSGTWTHVGSINVTSTGTINTISALVVSASLTIDPAATFPASIPITFNSSGAGVVTAPAYTFTTVTINKTGSLTIAAGTTIPLGASPTTTLNGSGFTAVLTVNGTVTVSGDWICDQHALDVGSTGTVSGALTSITLPGSFDIHASATFPSGVSINFTDLGSSTGSSTDAAGRTFGISTIDKAGPFSIGVGTVIPLGASPTIAGGGLITVNGEINVTSGTLTCEGGLTISNGAVLSGAATAIVINESLTFGATSTVTALLPVTFQSATTASVTATAYTFGTCVISKTGSFTIAAGTTIPVGANPTTSSATTGTTTLTITGTLSLSGNWTHTGGVTVSTTGVVSGALTSMSVTADLVINAAATFPASVQVTFNGSAASDFNAPSRTFGTSAVNKTAGTFILASGTTMPLGANPTTTNGTGAFTITGTITASGSWIHTGTGLFTVSATTGVVSGALTSLTLSGGLTIASTGTFPANVALTLTGVVTTTITSTVVALGPVTLAITNVVTLTIAANTALTMANGTWNLNTITVNGTMTIPVGIQINTANVTISAGATLSGPGTISHGGSAYSCSATATVNNAPNIIMSIQASPTLARTFAGGGKVYGTFVRTGSAAATASLTISGANTFASFRDNQGLVAHSIIFPNSTTTVGAFIVMGSAGKLVTLARTGASGVFTLTKSTAGDVSTVDYISVSNSTVDATPDWYAGSHSTNGGGNTNWIFADAPSSAKQRKSMFVIS